MGPWGTWVNPRGHGPPCPNRGSGQRCTCPPFPPPPSRIQLQGCWKEPEGECYCLRSATLETYLRNQAWTRRGRLGSPRTLLWHGLHPGGVPRERPLAGGTCRGHRADEGVCPRHDRRKLRACRGLVEPDQQTGHSRGLNAMGRDKSPASTQQPKIDTYSVPAQKGRPEAPCTDSDCH